MNVWVISLTFFPTPTPCSPYDQQQIKCHHHKSAQFLLLISLPAERQKKRRLDSLTCTSPTQRDGPIDHPMGSLVHLFKVLREEDQAAVKVAVADVSTDIKIHDNKDKNKAKRDGLSVSRSGFRLSVKRRRADAHPRSGPTIPFAFRSACVSAHSCGNLETGTQTSRQYETTQILQPPLDAPKSR